MRPDLGADIVQDTAANFFLDPSYVEIGHVAVGVRLCPVGQDLLDLLVQEVLEGGPVAMAPAPPGDGADQGRSFGVAGPLWLWRSSLNGVPVLVDTDEEVPGTFLGRPA